MEKTFGQKIREYRITNTSLSLRKVAEKVDISPTYLSRIENDKEPPPSEDIIIRIAKIIQYIPAIHLENLDSKIISFTSFIYITLSCLN